MTRRHTRAEVDAILDRRDREGLTYEELAELTGIAKTTLSWWSWRRRRESGQRRRGRSVAGFAEVVTVAEQPSQGTAMELTTPSGLALRIPADFDEVALERLLALLARRC